MKLRKIQIALKKAASTRTAAERRLSTTSSRAKNIHKALREAKGLYKTVRTRLNRLRDQFTEISMVQETALRLVRKTQKLEKRLQRKLHKAEKKLQAKNPAKKARVSAARNNGAPARLKEGARTQSARKGSGARSANIPKSAEKEAAKNGVVTLRAQNFVAAPGQSVPA